VPRRMKIPFCPSKLGIRGGAFIALAWLVFGTESTKALSYSLGATALLVGPAAGTSSVVLAATQRNATWTAAANASWLHLSAANQSGTGSTNVIFSFDANPGATRTGTLTIAGQMLTVTQAGSTYVAAGTLTTLVSSGLDMPAGAGVDGAGNVYIADSYDNAIKKWLVASNTVVTLISSGLNDLACVAVDREGNVFFPDGNTLKVWVAEFSGVLTVTVSSNALNIVGITTDASDNVYFCNEEAVQEWFDSSQTVTQRPCDVAYPEAVALDAAGNIYSSSGDAPEGISKFTAANSNLSQVLQNQNTEVGALALDGSGNIYFVNSQTIEKWTAASNAITTLVSSGLANPGGLAMDELGNLYIADTGHSAIKELPNAFLDPTGKTEGPGTGNDVLPPVLPATENLLPPFAPVSSQSWLTIRGITNGVVSFAFTSTVTNRAANITLLGQTIPVTQLAVVPPPTLMGAQSFGNGVFQFAFTNVIQNATFNVLSSTNLSLPLTNWNVMGTASNIAPGIFQFTDTQATNSQCFYAISSP
jgi:hypothetical protein